MIRAVDELRARLIRAGATEASALLDKALAELGPPESLTANDLYWLASQVALCDGVIGAIGGATRVHALLLGATADPLKAGGAARSRPVRRPLTGARVSRSRS